MQRKDHLDAFAIGLLIACCAFWGFQQVLVKATLAEVPPVFQAGVRFAATTVVLWLWCRWRGIALWERDGSLLPGLLAGFLFSMEFFCLFNGLQFSAASRLTVFCTPRRCGQRWCCTGLCPRSVCAQCNVLVWSLLLALSPLPCARVLWAGKRPRSTGAIC